MNEVTKNITEAYLQVLKGKPNLDEAKKLDPVDSKELKGTHAQRKDKDIDNDGDVDSSDEYLHNRRKTVAKAIKNESFDLSDYTVEEIKDFIMSEEFDQLDELSKATLGSYIKKSSDDRAQNAFNVGKSIDLIGKSGKINYKGLKRRQGISTATDKLTKESFDLDENIAGLFKNASEWEKSAKARGLVVKSATHPSGEITKYQTAKDKQGNHRGHFDHETKSGRLKEEAEQLDELSPNTLGRYASKSLRLGDIANRMSKSDDDGMGKIAGKRLAGVKKAVDKLADKTGKKALATFIKKDINKTKASGDAYTSGTGTDDHGKSYNKAMRNIGKMREEVELDEMRTPFVVIDTADGDKVVAMASDEKGARQLVNSAERPPMSIKDKSTLKIVKSNKKQFIGRPLNEQSKPTANYGPKDDTRDTFDKQLATRKGEENFVDMHKIETPEYVDAYRVNNKTFKALRMSVSNPKRRWNDLDIGDKKPVPNDGK